MRLPVGSGCRVRLGPLAPFARGAVDGSSLAFSLVRRTRQGGKNAFGAIAGVEHKRLALHLVDTAGDPSAGFPGNPALGARTGVVLLYPVIEAATDEELQAAVRPDGSVDTSQLVMAFNITAPKSANDSSCRLVCLRAVDSRNADAVVVDAAPAPRAARPRRQRVL